MQRQEVSRKIQMTALLTYCVQRLSCRVLIALAASAALILPAPAQDFGERSHKPQFPVENHTRVSEKDYKAALEKIPTPTQKYDPWGVAHTANPKNAMAPQKSEKKTN